MEPLLKIQRLRTYFDVEEGLVKAVDDASLIIQPKSVHALVGESGSGKSVTALSILRLIAQPPGRIVSGSIVFKPQKGRGVDLIKISEEEMRKIRGNRIAMIFQEPMTSLNPVFTVGDQIMEAIILHQTTFFEKPTEEIFEKVGASFGTPVGFL